MANYYVTSGTDPVPAQYAGYTIINTTSYDGLAAQSGYVVSVAEDSNVVIGGDVNDDVIIRTTGANLTDYNVTTTVLGDTTGASAGAHDILINEGGEGDVIPTLIVDGDASKFNATISDSASGTSTLVVNDGATLNSYTGYGDADNVTIRGTIGNITTGGGADSITVEGGTVTGTIDAGNSDVSNDTITLNNATVGGDISVGGGVNTITLENNSTLGGTLNGGAGVDNVTVKESSITGNILTDGNDDSLTLNNATIGGYVNQGGGDDSLTLAGTVNINGTYSSPTGIKFVDASIDQFSGDDTISIESGAVVNTVGVINQGANSAVGLNEDSLLFADQADAQAYAKTLGEAGFYDQDGDGTYTVQYNDNLGDKPLGSATGSEGEFKYSGTTFVNVDNTNAGWTCFTRGTLIETDRGPIAIEDLSVGDRVLTRDNGMQPIRWIGSKALSAQALAADEKLRPIRICRDALGAGVPSSDLLVSPQHRILIRSRIAQKMFGIPEVLVAAKQLCQVEGIDIAHDAHGVEYFHMLFDRHEVVISNGAETESLYTGPEALKSIGQQAQDEIFALFPELKSRNYTPVAARVLANGRRGRQLAVRHARNDKALVCDVL